MFRIAEDYIVGRGLAPAACVHQLHLGYLFCHSERSEESKITRKLAQKSLPPSFSARALATLRAR